MASALGLVLASACSPALLAQPEGDGGWGPERRQGELGRRARAGGVPFDGSTVPEPPASSMLSLAEALALTRNGNRRIREAEQAVAAAAARVRQQRGRLLPAVTGSGRYTAYTDSQRVFLDLPPGLLPPGAPDTFESREEQVGMVNATVTLPLDWTGELVEGLRAAQAGYRGERARLWATTLGEQVAVVRAYFDLLEAQRLREVTRQTIAFQALQLRNAEHRYATGRLTKNELLVVRVRLANAQQELHQRDLAVDHARWTLNRLLGRPVDAPTMVQDVQHRPTMPEAEVALAEAFAHNPVLEVLLEERQRLDATLAALQRGWLPRLEGGAAVDWNSQHLATPQHFGSGFVGIVWDLGTDGRRAAEIAETRARVEQARLALEGELRSLEAGIRTACRAIVERLAALDAAREAIDQAEENLRIRVQQFDAGRATSEDVLDAETLLAQQRAVLASALYQAHAHRAVLQQLLGLPLEELTKER